jgi:putative phage-type endonuclease
MTMGELVDRELYDRSVAEFGPPPAIGHAVPVMHEGLGREEWLASRVIGASDIPAILGISRYTSPLQLWRRMRGLDPPPELNYHMQRGHAMESVGLWVLQERGIECAKPGWLLRHPRADYLTCTLDGWTSDGEVVEVKAPGPHVVDDMQALIAGEPINPVGAVAGYVAQMHHQMLVTNAQAGWLVVMPGTKEPIVAYIRREEGLCERILNAAERFWSMVSANEQPEPMHHDLADIARRWRVEHKELQVTSPIMERMFDERDAAKAIEDEARAAYEAAEKARKSIDARLTIRAQIHGAKRLLVQHGDRRRKITLVEKAGRLDGKALAKEHPEIAEKYRKEGSREFRIS